MSDPLSGMQGHNAEQASPKYEEDSYCISLARGGDMGAFEALVRKYEAKVFNIASHMLSNADDAMDASQEVFIRVYRSLSSFRGDSKFSTWLYRVANNVCLDILRKRNYRVVSLDGEITAEDGEKQAMEIPDAFDVEAVVEKAEFGALVQKAINMLPEQHRAILVMRDMQDLSYTEISETLKLPEGTVKSRINRARTSLREIFLSLKELKDYLYVKQV